MTEYSEMVVKIEQLRKQAEKVRKKELSSVIKAIKKQMKDYGIRPVDLGFSSNASESVGRKPRVTSKRGTKVHSGRSGPGRKVEPKYRDELGNTWTGRGKKPKWVVEAISSGRNLDSLLIS